MNRASDTLLHFSPKRFLATIFPSAFIEITTRLQQHLFQGYCTYCHIDLRSKMGYKIRTIFYGRFRTGYRFMLNLIYNYIMAQYCSNNSTFSQNYYNTIFLIPTQLILICIILTIPTICHKDHYCRWSQCCLRLNSPSNKLVLSMQEWTISSTARHQL